MVMIVTGRQTMIKCDEAMRRSKEQALGVDNKPWRCTLRCDECHCALHKRTDGTWEHRVVNFHKGGKKDV